MAPDRAVILHRHGCADTGRTAQGRTLSAPYAGNARSGREDSDDAVDRHVVDEEELPGWNREAVADQLPADALRQMALAHSGRADQDRVPAVQESLLARLWDWLGSLWPAGPDDGRASTPVTATAGICDPDRGPLIDPNGNPCNK